MKNKCVIIGHPLNVTHLYKLFGWKSSFLKPFGKEQIKPILTKLGPQHFATIKDFKSDTGISIDAYALAIPLLPDQFVSLPEEFVLEKILKAIKYGAKRGAQLAVLNGFCSVIGNEGAIIAKESPIAVTSGNTYTACLSIDGILKASEIMKINLRNCTAAVIGATGDIGSICTIILSKKVRKINIAARNEKKLLDFANILKTNNQCETSVYKYITEAIKEADIILTVASAITAIIDPEDVKSGSVICDVAVPANVAREIKQKKKDVLVFEGGLAKPPASNGTLNKSLWRDELPPQSIYGCVAEGLILTLARKFENYSIGRGNITENKINEIRNMARDFGFSVADFSYCEKSCNEVK